jgi:hypothetical protein
MIDVVHQLDDHIKELHKVGLDVPRESIGMLHTL